MGTFTPGSLRAYGSCLSVLFYPICTRVQVCKQTKTPYPAPLVLINYSPSGFCKGDDVYTWELIEGLASPLWIIMSKTARQNELEELLVLTSQILNMH